MEVCTEADQRHQSSAHMTLTYQPRRALQCAIDDWLPEFYKPKGKSCLY